MQRFFLIGLLFAALANTVPPTLPFRQHSPAEAESCGCPVGCRCSCCVQDLHSRGPRADGACALQGTCGGRSAAPVVPPAVSEYDLPNTAALDAPPRMIAWEAPESSVHASAFRSHLDPPPRLQTARFSRAR